MSSRAKFNLNHTIFHDLAHWFAEEPSFADELYASPYVCLAVFQSLPPLARLYIPRLLHLCPDTPVPLNAFKQTLRRRQRAHDRHDAAVGALRDLHILRQSKSAANDVENEEARPETSALFLNSRFAANIRRAITYGLQAVLDGPDHDSLVSSEQLDKFSADCLEYILNYLVESSGVRVPKGKLVPALLGVGILEDKRSALCITSSGFHFLLKHSFAQLWVLLRSILIVCFSSNLLDPLRLLFALSFSRPGATYSMKQLTDTQSEFLSDLHELGIVMISEDRQTFHPTLVGVRLLGSANRVGADLSSADLPNITKTTGEIDVFVETNFRVFAYTSSPFQTNLLGLFTHLRYKLPGMVVGILTRDAVRNALMSGITGDQIIAYLNAHAHPFMKKGVIPSNVSDEIRLWEAEQDRVQMVTGILLSDFNTDASFDRVLSFANDRGAVAWSNSQSRQLFVDPENYDDIKQFVRQESIQ